MRRLAIISAILTVLVGIDGIYMVVAKYHPSDVNNYNFSDGTTVLIAAALLLIITVVAFVMSTRSQAKTAVNETAVNETAQPEVKGQDA